MYNVGAGRPIPGRHSVLRPIQAEVKFAALVSAASADLLMQKQSQGPELLVQLRLHVDVHLQPVGGRHRLSYISVGSPAVRTWAIANSLLAIRSALCTSFGGGGVCIDDWCIKVIWACTARVRPLGRRTCTIRMPAYSLCC